MAKESELETQIEWFHQFAALPRDKLAQQANAANRSAFARMVETCLTDHGIPEGQSPEQFAKTVLELRENERQWNHALSSVLIKADDLHQSQDRQRAATTLESCVASCPWQLFREVAQDQAANYRSLA